MLQKVNKNVFFEDLGSIDYQQAWDYQEKLFSEIIRQKIENRDHQSSANHTTSNYLLFCEHPPVYTLGKSGKEKNLLLSKSQLEEQQIGYFPINRGGDITFHGPGQLVAYPIFDLDNFFTDIHKYLRLLEEAVILTLKEYNIVGERNDGYTGVWLDVADSMRARKICAMGVRCSRWVTMHGLALNVNTDLSYFNNIIPCGISDKKVTSLAQELGTTLSIQSVKDKFKKNFEALFNCNFVDIQ